MNYFNQVCTEILQEIRKKNVKTQKQLNQIKLSILNKYKTNGKIDYIPKNADIYFAGTEEDRTKFKNLLSLKPVRTISGVAPIALMSEPYPCPHTMKGIGPCTYCPGGPGSPFGDVPQSYTGKEPSTRRSMRNFYDPYLIVFNRLEHYVAMGKIPDKAEIIIQGGTFTFFPKLYQEYFIKYALKAMNDFSKLFFDKDGNITMLKFKKFFELPRLMSEEDRRIKSIQNKLMQIKHLDLSNSKVKEEIDNVLFNSIINKNNIQGGNFIDALNVNLIALHPPRNVRQESAKLLKQTEAEGGGEHNKRNEEQSSSIPPNDKFNFNASREKEKTNQNDVTVSAQNTSLNFIEIQNKENANINAIKLIQNKIKTENITLLSLKQIQKENETSFIRCVGLTIETKSDFGKLYHGNLMLELGCTRVELGIQSIYDNVLEATNRGNTVQDNIESIRTLKDLGFKINAHYMPGLPLTTKEMDLKGLRELFENPDYKPDMLKIYPCMVMEGTKLYDDWKAGKFNPLTTKEAAEIIAEFKRFVPPYTRLMRLQRDIPTNVTSAGVDRTNLRQYVEKLAKEKGIRCRCIRCREIGHFEIKTGKKINLDDIKIITNDYEASHGKEFFISAEDVKNDILFGFVRLRFPSQFLREEITKDSALIRELHVYSAAVQIGKRSDDSFQHRGIGKQLLAKAEEIVKDHGKNKVIVIAGVGAREYFRKLGYELEGVYMTKAL